MKTLFRHLPWSVLPLFGLLLISAATRAQSATEAAPLNLPTAVFAIYTPAQHLALNWNSPAADGTRLPADTTAASAGALVDLRIGRPAPYAIGVALYWTNTQEPANAQFVIERRLEGQAEFHCVAYMPGQGAGQALHSYSFVDDGNASPQPSTYRLVQISPATGRQVSAIQIVPGAVPGPPEPDEEKAVVPSLALD